MKCFFKMHKWRLTEKIWHQFYKISEQNYKGAIKSVIHGHPVLFNNGYRYPINARYYSTFNNPLLELVAQTYNITKKQLTVVDVGAAIGDTALFLLKNSDDCIQSIICIDGDEEFFGYLNFNLKKFSKVTTIKSLLTDSSMESTAELVRTHAGTASAQGELCSNANSLDNIILKLGEKIHIDVIKVDVDGMDGKVLNGATEVIDRFKPNIIFEWHPLLYSATNNQIDLPFKLLSKYGYDKFLWYNKYGQFSHFDISSNQHNIKFMGELCLNNFHESDWHYDIIAIHKDTEINLVALAELKFSKNKQSKY